MQATTNELLIHVGENKDPIRVTGDAVRAVQTQAAQQMAEMLEELSAFSAGYVHTLDDMTVERLFEVRGWLQAASQAADVLIDCRPVDEWGFEINEGE